MKLDKRHQFIVKSLMVKYQIDEEQAIEIIESPFKFIRGKVKEVDVTNVETEEEFNEVTKNFNIPCIGKLYANYYNFKRFKRNESRKTGTEVRQRKEN